MLNASNAARFLPPGFVSIKEHHGTISIHPTSLYRRELREGAAPFTTLTVGAWTMPDSLRAWFAAPEGTVSLPVRELVHQQGPWDLRYAIGRAAPSISQGRAPWLRFTFVQETIARGHDGCHQGSDAHVQLYAGTDDGIVGLLLKQSGGPRVEELLASRADALCALAIEHDEA